MMQNKNVLIVILGFFFGAINAQVDITYNDLVWSDEFDANGAINSTNWHHQTQIPAGGNWYNGEQQHYTSRIENSFVNNGNLNIVAIKEPFTDQGVSKQYTSARLNSKFAFKYGRIDVRAKVPKNTGSWPAIWLLGKNINEPGGYFASSFGTTNWPDCGEIDIMEYGIFPSAPDNTIQSTLHTPSSFGASVNHGSTLASSDISDNYHIYSMNWSPNQITFLLDGVAYYTYNPAIKDASTWPFDEEQYLLLNIAMGGVAGTIPSDFTQASMVIDYVRVYQNTTPDTNPPTNFTATIGNVTGNSVELLLNATDDIGGLNYTIAYNGNTINTTGVSGVQKSHKIYGLDATTNYTFTVTVKDGAGNPAANNPIILDATTLSATPLICSGTSSEAQEGSFSTGYTYEFKTQGTDVVITFTLLDTDRVGVVAFLWNQNPFGETQMTNVTGSTFTHTLTGQTLGSTINYAVKFAYAGGLSVTKYYTYVVGSSCTLGLENIEKQNELYFQNPVNDVIKITSKNPINKVELYDLNGRLVLTSNQNNEQIDVSKLTKGVYLMIVYIEDEKIVNKIIVK